MPAASSRAPPETGTTKRRPVKTARSATRSAVLDGHRDRGVVLEGYSALRGGTLDHPVIAEVAGRHGRSTAQVIVRWHLQHGVVVIPKSEKEERIVANAQVGDFTLSEQDMAEIDALGDAS